MSFTYSDLIPSMVTFGTGLGYFWYWPMVTFGTAFARGNAFCIVTQNQTIGSHMKA